MVEPSPVTHTIDYLTFAADIAMGMQKLRLPPVHVIGAQSCATEVAIRLASVFPEKVLSVFACGLCPEVFSESTLVALNETFQCLVDPTESDVWEEGMMAFQWFYFAKDLNVDLEEEVRMIDEWTGLFLRRYSPSKATKLTVVGMLELGRETIPKEFSQGIHQPFMAVHGAGSAVFSVEDAHNRFLSFTNPNPRSKFEEIPGAPLVLMPLYTPLLVRKYMKWVQPILYQETKQDSSITDFEQSLRRLAEICGQPSMLSRDPHNSSNFYMIEKDMLEKRKQMLAHAEFLQTKAITLPGEDAAEWWTEASEEEKKI